MIIENRFMHMKKSIGIIAIALLFSACKADEITVEDVINELKVSDHKPLADGSTVIDLTVKLNSEADADKRNVVFRASAGGFFPASDTIAAQKANFEGTELIARIKYKVPSSPKTIVFTVQPEIRSKIGDFILKDEIISQVSLPTSLILTPSAVSVATNYAGEIQLTALLKNGNKNASADCKVVFEDYFVDGAPVNGRYRQKKESTDATSQATTFYSPGNLPPGTSFYIRCTYVDESNNKTSIFNTCLITAIQP